MSDDEKTRIDWAKFHWDKWKDEVTRFWKHIAFATILLVAFNLYQLDALQFNFPTAKLVPGINARTIKRWLICPVSAWLWVSIVFSLIDMLRHRVPEGMEPLIHNNRYPVPFTKKNIDLKSW